jgi:hypothetical protein
MCEDLYIPVSPKPGELLQAIQRTQGNSILSSVQQPKSPYIFITLQRQLVDFIRRERMVSTNNLPFFFFKTVGKVCAGYSLPVIRFKARPHYSSSCDSLCSRVMWTI